MKPKIYHDVPRDSHALDHTQVEYVEKEQDADFLLCCSTFPTHQDPTKTILWQKESPITSHRRWTYDNFHLFHTVVTHHPLGDNQIQFTDYPATYPWMPVRTPIHIRENTTITKRTICYFGHANKHNADLEDRWGTTTLYGTRTYISEDLLDCDRYVVYGPTTVPKFKIPGAIMGESAKYHYKHWPGMNPVSKWSELVPKCEHSSQPSQWLPKLHDINACGADFILVLENCLQPNLIADKLFDAVASDRVMLYLGEPHIERHVPPECFVDLRPIFDRTTRRIDARALLAITDNMTQQEYDGYIYAAREWRSAFTESRWYEERAKLTARIVKRLV